MIHHLNKTKKIFPFSPRKKILNPSEKWTKVACQINHNKKKCNLFFAQFNVVKRALLPPLLLVVFPNPNLLVTEGDSTLRGTRTVCQGFRSEGRGERENYSQSLSLSLLSHCQEEEEEEGLGGER